MEHKEQSNDTRHSTKAWNPSEQPSDAFYDEIHLPDMPDAPLTGHQWIQMGNELRCTSCSFGHASYIEPDFQLFGVDEKGAPMIRKIEVH